MRLESCAGKDLTSIYPEVNAAVVVQRSRGLLLDGEVVAYDGDQTSFTRLQQRLGVARPTAEQVAMYPVVYCVFDLLQVDGEDLSGLAIRGAPRPASQDDRAEFVIATHRGLARRLAAALRRGLPIGLGRSHRANAPTPHIPPAARRTG